MQAHVFDHADDGNTHLLKHFQTLARVDQCDVLRRGDNHRAGHRHALCQRQLDVASTRRQINHKIIEFAPVGVVQQLLERLRHHRATPHHGGLDVDQKADRHCLNAMTDQRIKVLAIGGLGLLGNTQHGRLRRAVNVGVEHANACTFGCQRQREIDGGGGFADTPFA